MANRLSKAVRRGTEALDDFLRHADLYLSRTAGGRLDNWCGIDRHTIAALLLPTALSLLLLLASPTSWKRAGIALFASFLICIALGVLMRISARRGLPLQVDLVAQAGAILLVCGLIAVTGSRQFDPQYPYLHLFVPVAAALASVLLLAVALVQPMFAYVRNSEYGKYLTDTELFLSRGPSPEVTLGSTLTALLTVPFRAPLVLLTPPALVTLFVPPVWAVMAPAVVLAVCLLALFFAGLNERFGTMWLRAQGALFRGGALLVTLAVIMLAALRIAGVSYATTILDTAAWWTIAAALASAYVLSWWYDYWMHRLLADEVLRIFGSTEPGAAGMAYNINESARRTEVPIEGRRLQVHGASRFVVLNKTPKLTYFQTHTLQELVERVATSGAPGGGAKPTPVQVINRAANFHVVVVTALLAILVATGLWLNKGEQSPEAEVTRTEEGRTLAELIPLGVGSSAQNPVIVLAASGGGTRAAVYSAAVLEGLARVDRSRNVIVASGVSGGGAALAYFAGHRKSLLSNDPKAWDLYLDKVTEPFIKDVLERASEWRMVSSGRLGMLLSKSFEDRWNLPAERATLGQIGDMGLIFNTSLAGHLVLPREPPPGGPLRLIEPQYRDRLTKSNLAGGRLLLTNLRLPADFSNRPLEPNVETALPVVLRDGALGLNVAAALNANFPPVFSNAAIDVDRRTRYWVTDGGAVDNRGIEMLLYTLRHALKSWPADKLPHLRVVVADASAFSDDYSQDRGLSTMSGAGARYASLLNAELYQALKDLYGPNSDRLQLTYLQMPLRWRESGSFGTHWMLQSRIRVKVGPDDSSDHVVLSGDEMVSVIRALYSGRKEGKLGEDACTVLRESRVDEAQSRHWQELLQSLGGKAPDPVCPARS